MLGSLLNISSIPEAIDQIQRRGEIRQQLRSPERGIPRVLEAPRTSRGFIKSKTLETDVLVRELSAKTPKKDSDGLIPLKRPNTPQDLIIPLRNHFIRDHDSGWVGFDGVFL